MINTYSHLKELHFLCEKNFIKFSKLSSLLVEKDECFFNLPGKDSETSLVQLQKTKLSKFTDNLVIKYEDQAKIKNIIIISRIYNEAKMMEVIEFQGFNKNLIEIFPSKYNFGFLKDERIQWNLFLSNLLTNSLENGRSVNNYLPTRI